MDDNFYKVQKPKEPHNKVEHGLLRLLAIVIGVTLMVGYSFDWF